MLKEATIRLWRCLATATNHMVRVNNGLITYVDIMTEKKILNCRKFTFLTWNSLKLLSSRMGGGGKVVDLWYRYFTPLRVSLY